MPQYANAMHSDLVAPVAVIGALNLDVCGMPNAPLRAGDSNPGSVRLSAGGVARNIAYRLARQGVPVSLITPMGHDAVADLLAQRCAAEGISLGHALRLDGPSPVYLSIQDAQGDLAVAVNAMSLLENMTPDTLETCRALLDAAPLVVCDANLPGETLAWLAQTVAAPLLLDPVSGFKAARARAVIGHFAAVKPNRLEAEALTGASDPACAANRLLAEGVGRVFISLGAEGVHYADASGQGRLPAPGVHTDSYNGAGDAMTAGIAHGMLLGESTRDCAARGIAAVTAHLLDQGGTLL